MKNRPIAVGGLGNGVGGLRNNTKVEEQRNGVWQMLDDFPFVTTRILGYSMVNFNEDLYLFGMFLFNQKLAIFNLLFF